MKLPKPRRPVRCHFCKKQLYYVGDKRYVSEVRVDIRDDHDDWIFYAHSSCFYSVIKR